MRAVRLVQAIGKSGRDQLPVARGQAEDQLRDLGHVEHRVAERDLTRQRCAGFRGLYRVRRDDEQRLEPHRRVEAGYAPGVADDETALDRGADVVRMAVELRGSHGMAAPA